MGKAKGFCLREKKKSPSQLFKHVHVSLCSSEMKPKHATMDHTLVLHGGARQSRLEWQAAWGAGGTELRSGWADSSNEPSTIFSSPTAQNKLNPMLILNPFLICWPGLPAITQVLHLYSFQVKPYRRHNRQIQLFSPSPVSMSE